MRSMQGFFFSFAFLKPQHTNARSHFNVNVSGGGGQYTNNTMSHQVATLETHMGETWRMTAYLGGPSEEMVLDFLSDAFDPPPKVGDTFNLSFQPKITASMRQNSQYIAEVTKVDTIENMQILSMGGLMMRIPESFTRDLPETSYLGLCF